MHGISLWENHVIEVYTDGAVKQGCLGWGFVVVDGDKIIHESCGILEGEKSLISQRNVASEMAAVMRGLFWVKKNMNGIKELRLVVDYKGCICWPTREWRARNKHTIAYANFVREIDKKIKINYKLVKGHNGDKWNEYADELAREGARKAYNKKFGVK